MNATKRTAKQVAVACETAVNALLRATVYAKSVRERIDPIQREVLAKYDYRNDLEAHGRRTKTFGERITDPNLLYLTTSDCSEYYAELHERYVALGYDLPEVGYCPALIAESLKLKAEQVLIECAEPFFQVKDRIYGDKREEYIDLLTKLVVNAPNYRKPELQKVG